MINIKELLSHHSNISLDSCVFIYHFEGSSKYSSLTFDIFKYIEDAKTVANCSTLILAEILALPYRLGDSDIAREYELLIKTFPNINLIPVSSEVAVGTAVVRSKYNLPTPDSIHIANALAAGSSLFITNDLKIKKVEGIDIIILEELL